MKQILSLSALMLMIGGVFSGVTYAKESTDIYGTHTYLITGYYSPLPDQSWYLMGDYEAEKRMNGEGIAGADGTAVYPGMVAAPPHIAFGTQVCVPGFGCGTVHDRGGAIVDAGVREGVNYPRLDLWMGYGEEGLRRALEWGYQQLEVQVHPPNSVDNSAWFDVPPVLKEVLDLPCDVPLSTSLGQGDKGKKVINMKECLADLGYLSDDAWDEYEANTAEIVQKFQLDFGVIRSAEINGAGRFGPLTRSRLQQVIMEKSTNKYLSDQWNALRFERFLREGMDGPDVHRLQELLHREGFFDHETTGYFGPLTRRALTKFQVSYGMVADTHAEEAGTVGTATLRELNQLLLEYYPDRTQNPPESLIIHEEFLPAWVDYGSKAEHITVVQEALISKGHNTKTTGYYGPLTVQAVKDFQAENGLEASGTVDPITRRKLLR